MVAAAPGAGEALVSAPPSQGEHFGAAGVVFVAQLPLFGLPGSQPAPQLEREGCN